MGNWSVQMLREYILIHVEENFSVNAFFLFIFYLWEFLVIIIVSNQKKKIIILEEQKIDANFL